MRIKLEKRQEPSKLMQVVTPIASVLLTMLVGVVVFDLLGIDGQRAVIDIFLTPLLACDDDGMSALHYFDAAVQLARNAARELTEAEFAEGMAAAEQITQWCVLRWAGLLRG